MRGYSFLFGLVRVSSIYHRYQISIDDYAAVHSTGWLLGLFVSQDVEGNHHPGNGESPYPHVGYSWKIIDSKVPIGKVIC